MEKDDYVNLVGGWWVRRGMECSFGSVLYVGVKGTPVRKAIVMFRFFPHLDTE